MLAALAEARRRGLTTIALVGYDGGRIAAEALADHVVVTRSQHIPRIQEAQASAYHVAAGARGDMSGRARVAGAWRAWCRASASGRTSTAWRTRSGLAGFVLNDARGVLVEVEGAPEAVERFLARLPAEAPPLASVESVACDGAPADRRARLRDPRERARRRARRAGPPDAATCDDCLAELFDPGDRRYRYPFINCTNCGPRFTIVRGVPYDRPLTTMAGFAMCAACRAEYDDPADRRFHAQPNACPACGPPVRLGGRRPATDAAAPGRRRAARRRDRRGQGPRRLPPGVPRRRRGRRRARCARASTARTARSR